MSVLLMFKAGAVNRGMMTGGDERIFPQHHCESSQEDSLKYASLLMSPISQCTGVLCSGHCYLLL